MLHSTFKRNKILRFIRQCTIKAPSDWKVNTTFFYITSVFFYSPGKFSFFSHSNSHEASSVDEFIANAMKLSSEGKSLYYLRPKSSNSLPIPVQLLYPVIRPMSPGKVHHWSEELESFCLSDLDRHVLNCGAWSLTEETVAQRNRSASIGETGCEYFVAWVYGVCTQVITYISARLVLFFVFFFLPNFVALCLDFFKFVNCSHSNCFCKFWQMHFKLHEFQFKSFDFHIFIDSHLQSAVSLHRMNDSLNPAKTCFIHRWNWSIIRTCLQFLKNKIFSFLFFAKYLNFL